MFAKVFLTFLHGKQGRNEGQQEGHNSLGAESFRGARKDNKERREVPRISQVLSSPTLHSLSKDLRFEHWGGKLVSCPGRHLTLSRA